MTRSGVVYSRVVDGSVLTFGVSGRLYKSNVLLYDHQTESLWSQLLEKAVSGPLADRSLRKLPVWQTSWKTWRARHPGTLVMSTDTGYLRDYSRDPYVGYANIGRLMFPVGDVRTDLSPKELIVGIVSGATARAYALARLVKRPGVLEDRIDEKIVRIEVTESGDVTAVTDGLGKPLPHIFAYWFAWQAFHPDTTVYGN